MMKTLLQMIKRDPISGVATIGSCSEKWPSRIVNSIDSGTWKLTNFPSEKLKKLFYK